MKISTEWLRTFTNPDITVDDMASQLTNAGLEVETIIKPSVSLKGVVVAEVLSVEKHPNADKLHVCQVRPDNTSSPLQIVCGAKNVCTGLKVPLAMIGASLPNGLKIKQAALRGIESFGMLCSAVELGLAAESTGLFELPKDAPCGISIDEYLGLNDAILEIAITPNRGDALSVLGIAREVAAINSSPLNSPTIIPLSSLSETESKKSSLDLIISDSTACPSYLGLLLHNINNKLATPLWMRLRLEKSGMRPINPVVDVLNYVMLELGQPLHAFDMAKIAKNLQVRFAKKGEKSVLLDGVEHIFSEKDLVICDDEKVLALAGIMGGKTAEVDASTASVFIESAFFKPEYIAESARAHAIHSEASYRFERGVDPLLADKALERVLYLLQEIGVLSDKDGTVYKNCDEKNLPMRSKIALRKKRVQQVLGMQISDEVIKDILVRLNMQVEAHKQGWEVLPSSYRLDINLEIDLIEEIARIYGYDRIAAKDFVSSSGAVLNSDRVILHRRNIASILTAAGYYEVITYSFIDKKWQELFVGTEKEKALQLSNPIADDMTNMRTSILPGLLQTVLYNQKRQQKRMRFFEMGLTFLVNNSGKLEQNFNLALAALGQVNPENWDENNKNVDFFALKNDLENAFRAYNILNHIEFRASEHPSLHPKVSAEIYFAGKKVGFLGLLHPKWRKTLEIGQDVYVSEIDLSFLKEKNSIKFKNISKFPCVERDLAIVLDKNITWQKTAETIRSTGGDLLQGVRLFDIYEGQGISTGQRSLALHLNFQSNERTLTEEQIDVVLKKIVATLEQNFQAKLRG